MHAWAFRRRNRCGHDTRDSAAAACVFLVPCALLVALFRGRRPVPDFQFFSARNRYAYFATKLLKNYRKNARSVSLLFNGRFTSASSSCPVAARKRADIRLKGPPAIPCADEQMDALAHLEA